MILVLAALAGGFGAAARFVLDSLLRARIPVRYPVGTAVINASGSLLLGLVTGLAAASLLSPELQVVLGTGLLGGYTTFSTASVETVRLVREGRAGAALAHSVGMLVTCTAFAALGLAAGMTLAG
ncbi:fluoride efflux transporter CrcB [Planctomonas deserti]|uniref:fluoride efflux transporter CrcB n=1 Tax=Planctomonas deserti TaxID=2144185 RepID=UPI000D340A67|nr:fluoride efflux transporter CrcB [Planctomonas deserti]